MKKNLPRKVGNPIVFKEINIIILVAPRPENTRFVSSRDSFNLENKEAL